MALALGIDTGGTYTDAVLVDQENGRVLAEAKALTTRRDLGIGIGQALRAAVAGHTTSDIGLVGLSTTLATNAIVEGQGSSACLMLIGYDRQLLHERGFARELATQDIVYIDGGHNGSGEEIAALDEEGARRAIAERADQVEAFAVSGYFSVRNPTHEKRVRAIIEELTAQRLGGPLPVTCAHVLTTRLDSVRRATTAALNARLIPLLHELLSTVQRTLHELDITAPLMVVRGDGSLVRAAWAQRRPIETILSGPAASVVGAWHLAGRLDAWVMDVGGTTTDIAVLEQGRPRLHSGGAQVGRWRTMIETVDVSTAGLGGDSHVRLDSKAALGFALGPQRVVPLCLLAHEHPEIIAQLERQGAAEESDELNGEFALPLGRTAPALDRRALAILQQLDSRPRPLIELFAQVPYGRSSIKSLDALVAGRLVQRAGFTPTDALHALGLFKRWDARASSLGAELLAAALGISAEALCRRVVASLTEGLAQALVCKILGDETATPAAELERFAQLILARGAGKDSTSDLACQLLLAKPLVAIGAPVQAYAPRAAEQVGAELVIPERAEVANALGAVVGGVVQRQRVLVRPRENEKGFQVFLPDGAHVVANVEEGVARAQNSVPDLLRTMGREAGAEQVEVNMVRKDHSAPTKSKKEQIFIETELVFVAVGRPTSPRGKTSGV